MNDLDGLKRQMEYCIQSAFDKGYKKGIADGNINDGTFAEKVQEAYDNGLEDAWEVAKKIVFDTKNGGLPIEVLNNIFGYYTLTNISNKYTVQEVVAKITEYDAENERYAENHVDWHEVAADDMTEAQLRRAVKELRKENEELKYGAEHSDGIGRNEVNV